MNSIKLIATDIDGTLFDDDHKYDVQRLNNYLKELHQKGVKFTVASGNNYDHLERIFKESPDIDIFIAENGSQIISKGKTLYEKTLPHDLVIDMLSTLSSELDLNSMSLSGKKASYAESTDSIPLYHINNLKIVDDLTKVKDDIFKFNIQLKNTDLDTAVDLLNEKYHDSIYAAVSGFGSIDIMSSNVNKSLGLQHLTDALDMSLDNVMAFGDNTNDLEMLKEVGLSYAMKNAKQSILDIGDRITKHDNNHDGVLNSIGEFFNL